MCYQDLKGFEDKYEIWSEAPYNIKNKKSGKIVKEYVGDNGYVRCWLNGKNYLKHRLIANQFVPNPNNLEQVDHIDRDKRNNNVSNLRWVSNRQNCNNRSNNKIVKNIPDDSIEVDKYGDFEFEFLYFSSKTDRFYFFTGIDYVERKPIKKRKYECYYIRAVEKNNIHKNIYYNKFKREYDLI